MGVAVDMTAEAGAAAAAGAGRRSGEVALPAGSDTVRSVELTAAIDAKLTVDIYGFKDGAVLYHSTVKLADAAPTRVHLDYAGVDMLEFVPSAGRHGGAAAGRSDALAIDGFVFGDGMAAAGRGGHAALAAAFGADRAGGAGEIAQAVAQGDPSHLGLHPVI